MYATDAQALTDGEPLWRVNDLGCVPDNFELTLTSGALGDVYVDCPDSLTSRQLIETLDQKLVRAVTTGNSREGRSARPERWLRGCTGLICHLPDSPFALHARSRALPVLDLAQATPAAIDRFVDEVLAKPCRQPAYAFYIGRLERDFQQAREAIRAAVQEAAGIEFLWIDDGRHLSNVGGVRERTRLLIQHAEFVVADLTLGTESPRQENPSRAHEIGLAQAYERPLFLSSQEPRRYPYFSVADLQMVFWQREDELHACLRSWIEARSHLLTRRSLNRQLGLPALPVATFQYDAATRFIGPNLLPST